MQAYEYISTVGEGAYGEVWKCQERATGRIVAIKGFKQAHEDKAIMRLAVREARVLEGLDHPNLVKMLAAFKSKSGRVYLVVEFVGPSLHAQLDLQPTGLAPPATTLLAWQLINGVSYLHDAKILHRDIKPANVLLCPSGVAKLCDFGFARSVSCGPRDAQRCTTYCVTRWYRAPEVLVGDLYGAAADVWSIGCTLAETATGRALFPGNSTTDQLYRVMSCLGPLAPLQAARMSMNPRLAPMAHTAPLIRKTLRQRLPELEPRLFELIEACLQVDPRRRPTVRELLQMPYFWDARRVAASVPPVDKLMVAAAAGEFTNLKRTPPPSASQPKTPAPGLERRPAPESSVQAPVERTALPTSGALPAAAAAAAADAAPPTEPASAALNCQAPNCQAPNCQAVDASFMASSDTCGTPGTTTTVASPPSSQPASSRATLAGPGSIAAAASAVTASAMLHAVAAVAEARRQAAASLTAVADQDPQLCGGGRCNARPRATSAVASCGPDGVIPARPPAVTASRDTGSNATAKAAAAMLLVSPVKAAPAGAAAAAAASPATAMASMPPAPGSWAGRVSSGFGFLPSLTMGPKASFGRGAGSVLGDTWDEAATPVGAPELHGQPGFVPPHVRPSTRALNSLEHRRLGSVPSLALAETKGARLLLRCATAVGELLDLGTSRRESSVGSIGSVQGPCASSARAKGASASATGEDWGTSASTGANVVGCERSAWATAPLARLLTSNPIASVKEEDEEGTDGGTSRQLAATTNTATSTTAGGGGEAVLGSSLRKSCSQPDFFDLHRRQQEAAAAGAAAHAAHAAHTVSTVDAQDVESLHTTAPASSAQRQGRGLDPDQGLPLAVMVAAASASSVIASASSNRSLSHTVPRPLSPCIEQAAPGTAAAHAAGLDVSVHDSSASTGAGAVQAFALSVGQVDAALGSGRWRKAEEGGSCCDVEVEVLPPPGQAAAQEAAGAAAGAATAPGACNAVAHVSMPESDRGHKGVAPRAKGGKGWVRTIQRVLACGVRRM